MNRILHLLLLAACVSFMGANGQIPQNPNKQNAKGGREGKWTLLFDRQWKPVTDTSQAAYYRLITYTADKPTGVVRDYYKSGALQFEGMMFVDRPTEILDGKVTYYNHRAREAEVTFRNGEVSGDMTLFYFDGTAIDEPWQSLTKRADKACEEGNKSECQLLYEKAWIRARYEFDRKDDGHRQALFNLASLYKNKGNAAEAEPLYEELKELQQGFGTQTENYRIVCEHLWEVYKINRSVKKAVAFSAEFLGLTETQYGKTSKEYGNACLSLATYYDNLKQHEKALPLFDQSLDILKTADGPESISYTMALYVAGYSRYQAGDVLGAVTMFETVKQTFDKVNASHERGYEEILNTLGVAYKTLGNYPKAKQLLTQSRELHKEFYGAGSEKYAQATIEVGEVYKNLGDYSKAEALLLEAQEALSEVAGRNSLPYARALQALGELYSWAGNYPKAEGYLLEAVRTMYNNKKAPDQEFAMAQQSLGNVYYQMGNYLKAVELTLEASDEIKALHGENHPLFANAMITLGRITQKAKRYQQAESYFLKAREIFGATQGKQSGGYGNVLRYLALHYIASDDIPKAESNIMEAMEIQRKTTGEESPDYLSSAAMLGGLYLMQPGKYSTAELLLARHIETAGRVFGKESANYMWIEELLAMAFERQKQLQKAEPLFRHNIDFTLMQIQRDFPYLSEKEREYYYLTHSSTLGYFESFCMKRHLENPLILGDLYNEVIQIKGLLLQTSNKVRQRIASSGDASLVKKFDELKARRNSLTKVYQMSVAEKQQLGINERWLEEHANKLEKELSKKADSLGLKLGHRAIHWEDIRQKLAPGEAAVEIVLVGMRNEGKISNLYAALLLTPDTRNHPEVVVLSNYDEMEKKFVRYYSNAITSEIRDEITYGAYWKPIADRLKGIKKIYVSPDGVYNQINLNTLFNPATGKYLIDEVDIQVVGSTRDIVSLGHAAPAKIKDIALFAYPDYNNSASSSVTKNSQADTPPGETATLAKEGAKRFFDGKEVAMLPGTKIEAETIAALLNKKGVAVKEFILALATEEAVKNIRQPQVLHIATHGFFVSDLPEDTEDQRLFGNLDAKKVVENPLLRSGLLFAGAGNAFKSDQERNNKSDDGILTAFEAMNLNLDQTDLVVLSACETGMGVVSSGEGVYGLQRAFQIAGSKSVLMSLWKVSDEATHILMTMFYENWLQGKTPREAFRTAQLALREKYPSPYYWGAFVLVGE